MVIVNGLTLTMTILTMSAVFYFGTIGVLDRGIDRQNASISDRLITTYAHRPLTELADEIDRELHDRMGGDTEIFLLTAPSGQSLIGNISIGPAFAAPHGRAVERSVVRDGQRVSSRLLIRQLPGGGLLYVGRDLGERQAIRLQVWRAFKWAAVIAFVLLILAALVLRRQIEARIGRIRHAARHIEAGNLNSRINISGDDEFARLSIEINRMLDRMEQLVDGVRQVSNAIAHDLRTPLMRVRVRLDDALTCDLGVDDLRDAASAAIDGIDELVLIFNKLLKMAEAESGLRTESLVAIDLSGIVRNMADLYDATAEEQRVRIHVGSQMPIWVNGDRDLLSSAVASLIDNAIKYAGPNRRVEVFAYSAADGAWIVVQDNGPGVPGYELPRLVERFYRVDQSRGQPGNGLGLGIVSAIAKLHGGKLVLANLSPGFRASIMLPTKAESFRASTPMIGSRPQSSSASSVS